MRRMFENFSKLSCHKNKQNIWPEKMENEDELVKLPDDTQQILNEFLKERSKQEKEDLFAENWNLSQFW